MVSLVTRNGFIITIPYCVYICDHIFLLTSPPPPPPPPKIADTKRIAARKLSALADDIVDLKI